MTGRLRALIITRRAHAASARRAAEGFVSWHGHRPWVVVLDDRFGVFRTGATARWFSEFADVIDLADIDLADIDLSGEGSHELPLLALLHEATEFAGAMRPHLISHFQRQLGPEDALLCLPDDAEVHADLGDLRALAVEHDIVVVPTRRSSAPRDGRLPDEVGVGEAGRIDPELVVVGTRSDGALSWWRSRVGRSPRIDPGRLRPATRHWLDELPVGTDIATVDDPTVGVSYLNADEAGRLPARLMRFSGWEPSRPWLLSAHAREWPRVLLSEHPWLAQRCAARLAAWPDDDRPAEPAWEWDVLPGGTRLDPAMRRAYERGLLIAEGRGDPEPPNGFRPGEEDAFLRWLAEPAVAGSSVSRYLAALHECRPDLRARFPDPQAPEGYPSWIRLSGRRDGVPQRFLPVDPHDLVDRLREPRPAGSSSDERDSAAEPQPETGVNIVGLFRAELGVGEAGRLLLDTVRRTGERCAVVVNDTTAHRQRHPFVDVDVGDSNPFDVNIIAVNADALGPFAARVGPPFFDHRITVGLWFWETERFPERFASAFQHVDEVWVASEHVRAAIAAAAPPGVDVHTIPLGATVPAAADAAVAAGLGVPRDRFVFLFVFDYESVAERKNPWGVMRAFRTAFPDPTPGGPVLVLKTINAELHLPDAERVRVAASDPDVLVLDGYLAADERDALMERADAYVSLHRCEGWGLTLAEAMSRGKPVVATAYSGNLEFMTETNSWLIPYRLTDIAEVSGAYRDGGRWADPDIAAAARAMREIVENPAEAAKRGSEAARDLAARRASDAGPRAIARRLAVLRERVRPNGPRRQHPQSLPTREGTP